MRLRYNAIFGSFVVFICAASVAPPCHALNPPVGNGTTRDDVAINAALKAAAATCGTVTLQCTQENKFLVQNTIVIPPCVKLVGACGAVPDERSSTTVGTTLIWQPPPPLPATPPPPTGPVVAFHDSPGASLSGVSIACQNAANATIGILYDSDDFPHPSSFVNIDTLMIMGCHQALVLGLPGNTAIPPCVFPSSPAPVPIGCSEADQLKFERFRILGNSKDLSGEGIHINSANAAQGSLIFNGNIQAVNIGIHIIETNGGLIVENTNYGSSGVGSVPAFMIIEPTVAVSPTLINDEVEGVNAAIIDHGCNSTPGNPVWLNNAWNDHQVTVDGNESITSIGTVNNKALLSNSTACATATPGAPMPHVVSINESGWSPTGSPNIAIISQGAAAFGASLIDYNVIQARGPGCTNFPGLANAGDLAACEGQHSGQLFLGQDLMLLNSGAGPLNTGTLKIQAGLDRDGSGLKHQTVSTGGILKGSAAIVVLTWATAFADPNYQAVCTVQDNYGALQLVDTSVPAPDHLNAEVKNNDGLNTRAGTLACFAIHN